MKKIRVEVQTTLTYTPFENIGELLKNEKKEEKKNGCNSSTDSNG